MKPIFAACAIVAFAFPAASQGNAPPGDPTIAAPPTTTPLSAVAKQALDACPSLTERTDSANANGYQTYFYASDCECMARSIDSSTWNESSADFDGPPMPDSDAWTIANALVNGATIEDAFNEIDSNISSVGYSAASACFGK